MIIIRSGGGVGAAVAAGGDYWINEHLAITKWKMN